MSILFSRKQRANFLPSHWSSNPTQSVCQTHSHTNPRTHTESYTEILFTHSETAFNPPASVSLYTLLLSVSLPWVQLWAHLPQLLFIMLLCVCHIHRHADALTHRWSMIIASPVGDVASGKWHSVQQQRLYILLLIHAEINLLPLLWSDPEWQFSKWVL